MKQIKYVSATRHKDGQYTSLYKSLSGTDNLLKFHCENTTGLSAIYNKHIISENKDKIIVFVHDDVYIKDFEINKTLNNAMQEFDIVGLAGVKAPISIDSKIPSAWHIMGKRENFSGCVYHTKDGKHWATSFGPMPERVLLIDGLFMAINVEKILNKGVKFDEQFTFHHYDLSFCIDANKAGLKIGVVNIPVIHSGLGDSMHSKQWQESHDKFIKKYS